MDKTTSQTDNKRMRIFHFPLQATFKCGLSATENVTIEPDPQIDKLNHKSAKFSRIAQVLFQFAQKMSQQAKNKLSSEGKFG